MWKLSMAWEFLLSCSFWQVPAAGGTGVCPCSRLIFCPFCVKFELPIAQQLYYHPYWWWPEEVLSEASMPQVFNDSVSDKRPAVLINMAADHRAYGLLHRRKPTQVSQKRCPRSLHEPWLLLLSDQWWHPFRESWCHPFIK